MAEHSPHATHPHPARASRAEAARLLRSASERLGKAVDHHDKGEHHTAGELARVHGHLEEAHRHLIAAEHLHAAHAAQDHAGDRRQATGDRVHEAHPAGSHWNDPDFEPEPDDV